MVSDSLKLDLITLSRLNYHWLWGLWYSKTPQPMNLRVEVVALMKDEVKLTRMIASQRTQYEQHPVIRFFYWLFNINNYSYHAYVLAACKGHQQYLQSSLEENPEMKEVSTFVNNWWVRVFGITAFLAYASTRISRILPQAASKPESGLAEKTTEELPSNALVIRKDPVVLRKAITPIPVPPVESVLVTSAMQPHLVVLGIHLNPGASLIFPDFKAVCRARFLASHPDKPGGTKEEFCRVKEAAERLTQMMSSRSDSSKGNSVRDNLNKVWTDFRAWLDNEIAEIERDRIKTKAEYALALTNAINALEVKAATALTDAVANAVTSALNAARTGNDATITRQENQSPLQFQQFQQFLQFQQSMLAQPQPKELSPAPISLLAANSLFVAPNHSPIAIQESDVTALREYLEVNEGFS